jgi:hypothetical protein
MAFFVGDEPGNAESRRASRITAHFSVSFRELNDDEATALAGMETMPELPVEPPVAPKAVPGAPAAEGAGLTENLSQGGLSFSGDLQLLGTRHVERGKKLLVEFHLPGESQPVRAVAVVAWSIEGKGEHGKFTAGLMFLGVASGDLEKIQRYIESQSPQS